MSSPTGFILKNHMYPVILITSDQPNVQYYYYLSIFLEDTQNKFFFITISWIHSLNFIPVYLKFTVITFLIRLLQLYFLFHPTFFVLFCLFSFSLGVESSPLIFSYTNHLQYHVIIIGVFSLE